MLSLLLASSLSLASPVLAHKGCGGHEGLGRRNEFITGPNSAKFMEKRDGNATVTRMSAISLLQKCLPRLKHHYIDLVTLLTIQQAAMPTTTHPPLPLSPSSPPPGKQLRFNPEIPQLRTHTMPSLQSSIRLSRRTNRMVNPTVTGPV